MKVSRRTFKDLRVDRTNLFGEYSEFSFFDRHRQFLHPLTFYFLLATLLLVGSSFLHEGRYFLVALYSMLLVLGVSRIRMELAVRKVSIRHRPMKRTYREGDEVEVTIEIENRSPFSLSGLCLEDHFHPASNQDVRFELFRLDSFSRVRKRYRAKCDSGMGKKKIGPAKVTVVDPTGAFEFDIQNDEELSVEVLPHIQMIPELKIMPPAESHHFGIYEVSNRGASVCLAGIRSYDNGDSPRHISWRLSTRGRGLVVKDFEKSVNAAVNIVLNLEPFWQLGKGADSTWEYAKDIALAIVSQQAQHGNFVSFMSGRTIVEPGTGENHVYQIASRIAALELDAVVTEKSTLLAESRDLKMGSLEKFEPLFSRGSEVFYIVPFNEAELQLSERSLRRLRASGFHVNVVFLDTAAYWRKHIKSIPASNMVPSDLFQRLPEVTKSLRTAGIRVYLASPERTLMQTFRSSENPL